MATCKHCGWELEYQRGHAATRETPEELAGRECAGCGEWSEDPAIDEVLQDENDEIAADILADEELDQETGHE